MVYRKNTAIAQEWDLQPSTSPLVGGDPVHFPQSAELRQSSPLPQHLEVLLADTAYCRNTLLWLQERFALLFEDRPQSKTSPEDIVV